VRGPTHTAGLLIPLTTKLQDRYSSPPFTPTRKWSSLFHTFSLSFPLFS